MIALLITSWLQVAPAAVVDRIAAVVNDEVIALSEVYELGGPFIEERCKLEVPKAACELEAELQVLDSLILRSLITQELTSLGMPVDAQEVDRTIDQIGRDNGIEDREDFRAAIETQGITWSAYREQLTEQIRQMKFNETVLRPRITVDEDEVRDRYNRTVREFKAPPSYELQAIGMGVPPPETTPSETGEPVEPTVEQTTAVLLGAIESARALSQQINAGEVEWQAAVTEHDTLGRGGNMGTLKKGEMSPAIEAAVLSIEAGTVTEPVVMGEMIFLIKLVSVKESGVLDYEAAADRIRVAIYDEKLEEELEQWYQQARRQASLKVLLRGE